MLFQGFTVVFQIIDNILYSHVTKRMIWSKQKIGLADQGMLLTAAGCLLINDIAEWFSVFVGFQLDVQRERWENGQVFRDWCSIFRCNKIDVNMIQHVFLSKHHQEGSRGMMVLASTLTYSWVYVFNSLIANQLIRLTSRSWLSWRPAPTSSDVKSRDGRPPGWRIDIIWYHCGVSKAAFIFLIYP